MATADPERILLAVDACSELTVALAESLVNMAARLGAELDGLFIEDVELMRAAELPFVREVSAAGQERMLSPDSLRQSNRETSRDLERLLARVAGERKVRWRYGTAQGTRVPTALAAAERCDLFMPARLARTRRPVRQAGEMFRRVALVVHEPAHTARALAVVHALARNGHTREVLLLCEGRPPAELVAALAGESLRTYVQRASMSEPGEVLEQVRTGEPGLLIVPKVFLGSPTGTRVLEALPMSVLALR